MVDAYSRVVAIVAAILLLAAGAARAQQLEEVELEPAKNDPGNVASLQRGARNFMNYCAGCHSAKYVRYNVIAKDLMLQEQQVIQNLMFNAEKTFETIEASMPSDAAERWFGRQPPDLSLIARSRGTDYIYNFLRGFYVDPESPTGVDNRFLPNTAMPNVLWRLQGYQKAVYEPADAASGGVPKFSHFESVTTGALSPKDFDDFVRDTVNFLEYISEPVRATRRILGVWVLIFLGFFFIVAKMLKNQIWKDVS